MEGERKAKAEDEYAALMEEYAAIAEERKNCNRKMISRNPLFMIPVETLGLGERARNRLRFRGILSLGQLLLFDEEDLLRIRGMGKRTAKEVQDCLELYMKEQFDGKSTEKAKELARGMFMIRVKESDRKQGMQFPDFEDMGDYQDSHIADLISTLGVNAMMGQTEYEIGDSGIYITAEPTGHTGDPGIEDFKAASSEFLRLVKQALPKMGPEYQKLYTHFLDDYQKEGVCMPFYGRIL